MQFGEERMAPANGIELCYQEMGDPDGEPLLLVMGLATQMIAWDEELLRDCWPSAASASSASTTATSAARPRSTRPGVPSRIDMLSGRRATAPYLLRDMAADTVGLMDHLGIESAHLVGASMGGMIVQTMAIEHPERVRSMVSIMSTTGSRWVGLPTFKAFGVLLGTPPRSREAAVERVDQDLQRDRLARLSPSTRSACARSPARSYDRGHSAAGVVRQLHAITASGDRTRALQQLELPTTVIHGNSDVLVRPSGGRATAKAIPGARLKMIEGMGHDLPRDLWPTFAEEIAATASRTKPVEQPARSG